MFSMSPFGIVIRWTDLFMHVWRMPFRRGMLVGIIASRVVGARVDSLYLLSLRILLVRLEFVVGAGLLHLGEGQMVHIGEL
jgi:hypothetical protein